MLKKKFLDIWQGVRFPRRFPDLFDDDVHRRRLEAIRNRFQGRQVALIGNAKSIFDREDGVVIDATGLVVRLNRGFVEHPAAQGERTDLLCLATRLTVDEVNRRFGSIPLVFMTPKRWSMSDDMIRNRGNLACYPLQTWRELSAELGGARPSIGIMTADLLHTLLGVSSIRLYGFDWKKTQTFYSHRHDLNDHNWEKEKDLMKTWAAEGWLHLPPS